MSSYDAILSSGQLGVLFVLFNGRSGTVFFQSLLDGHPQVMMFPSTTLIAPLPFDDFWNEHGSLPPDELTRVFCDKHPILFDPTGDRLDFQLDRMGPGRDEKLAVSRDEFHRHVLGFLTALGSDRPSRRDYFLALHHAYALARGEDLGRKRVLVHALHMPDRLETLRDISRDFPHARSILMVRHPFRTHASHYRHHVEQTRRSEGPLAYELRMKVRWPRIIATQMIESFGTMQEGLPPDSIRALRLEDVHLHPRPVMESVCAWLGLEFDECLLQSTFGGKLWWADVGSGPPVNGFSKHVFTDGWKKDYTRIDKAVIADLLGDRFERYGYSLEDAPRWPPLLVLPGILVPNWWEWQVVAGYFRPETLRWIGQEASRAHGAAGAIFPYKLFMVYVYLTYLVNFVLLLALIVERQVRYLRRWMERRSGRPVTFELLWGPGPAP